MTSKYTGMVPHDRVDGYARVLRAPPRRKDESEQAFHARIDRAHAEYREDYDVYFATGIWPERQRLLGRGEEY